LSFLIDPVSLSVKDSRGSDSGEGRQGPGIGAAALRSHAFELRQVSLNARERIDGISGGAKSEVVVEGDYVGFRANEPAKPGIGCGPISVLPDDDMPAPYDRGAVMRCSGRSTIVWR